MAAKPKMARKLRLITGCNEWMMRAIAGYMACRRYCYQKLGAIIAGSLYHAMKCVNKVLYRSLPHRVRNLMCTLIGLVGTLGGVARIRLCALELELD